MKNPALHRVLYHCGLFGQSSEFGLDQTKCHGFVTSGNQFAAWCTNAVLGHLHAIASFTAVGINCKACLKDVKQVIK